MIRHLHIENYALIEHLDIDLHSGFSVITGETGAGKSIIIGAVGLLLGQRADSRAIKEGAKRCVIEALFDVSDEDLEAFFEENDLDYDASECVLRRELTAAGKSRAFINDTPVSLIQLKEIGERLIDVHSQHKNLLLGKENFQLSILDALAGNQQLLADYQAEYKEYRLLCRQLEEAVAEAKRNREDEDYLRYQAEQLAEADLKDGEQEELEAELETLEHAEEIKSSLFQASGCLRAPGDGADALALLRNGIASLRSVAGVYASADELAERMDSCYIELKDIADELESQAEDVEYNPRRLAFVQERLDVIYSLQKKHGVDSADELLSMLRELEEKLLSIENSDDFIEEIRAKMHHQEEKAQALAKQLSEARHAEAKVVEKAMAEKLVPLGMPNVRFKCSVQSLEDELSETGYDQVQFLFNANKSGELKPVSQIASGGEIARVMLSLKALVAGEVKLPTIIFDEIDTGVSGSIAEKMAKMMDEMSRQGRQVLSITHLPQIAALGCYHYKVYKEDTEEETLSHIVQLEEDERVAEIAHMLSGETLTQAALDNARSLLENNH